MLWATELKTKVKGPTTLQCPFCGVVCLGNDYDYMQGYVIYWYWKRWKVQLVMPSFVEGVDAAFMVQIRCHGSYSGPRVTVDESCGCIFDLVCLREG